MGEFLLLADHYTPRTGPLSAGSRLRHRSHNIEELRAGGASLMYIDPADVGLESALALFSTGDGGPKLASLLQAVGGFATGTATNDFYVDGGRSPLARQDGSFLYPFLPIQDGLLAVPQGLDSVGARNVHTVRVAGGTYNEAPIWDVKARRIQLIALAPVNLGEFNERTWQPSGIRRNITFVGSGNNVPVADNIRSRVMLGTASEWGFPRGTVNTSFTAFRISGMLDVQATTDGSAGNIDWGISGVEVYGTTGDSSGISFQAPNNPNMLLNIFHSRFHGVCDTGLDGRIIKADEAVFSGPVRTEGWTEFVRCDFLDGLFVQDPGSLGRNHVVGFLQCAFSGLFDGVPNPNDLLVDRYTHSSFLANGASLGPNTFLVPSDVVP